MRKTISNTLSEAKGKFEAYTALLDFRYSNLCVDSDARALLSVTVEVDSSEMHIEKCSWVKLPDKDHIAVYPMNQDYVPDIGKGVMLAHPEFKMDIEEWESYPKAARVEGEKYVYLLFTMPEVNKDRRDLLLDGVKLLHDQWEAKCNLVRTDSSAKLMECLDGQEKETIDKIKDQLEDYYNTCHDKGESATEDKKKEIEEGYQRYLQNRKDQEVVDKAKGEEVGLRMKMGEESGELEEEEF